MAKVYNVHEAKTNFSRLLELVERGEEIVIAKAGRPVAHLTRAAARPAKRSYGMDKGKVRIADDFNDFTPDLEAEFTEWKY